MKVKLSVVSCWLSVRRLFFSCFFLLAAAYCLLSTGSAFAEEITSRAALVMEASTGRVLYAKNPTLKLPPASTTKLVTAMVVLDRAQLNETVKVSAKAANVPSLKGTRFREGETFTVETLLYAALLRSANDAAYALAEAVAGSEQDFVELMNRKVLAIGAVDTKFINTTGLPGKGQHITAYDLAKILRYALKYPVIKEMIGTKETEICTKEGRVIPLENTDKLLWSDEGAIGGKTGYTRAARHCFTYAGERNGETVIVAMLGAPSRKVLWSEAEELVDKGFEIIASSEQPTVYFTKADYTESPQRAKLSRRHGKSKTGIKTKVAKSSSKKKSKRMQAKKKDANDSAKNSRKRDMKVAENWGHGIQG